MLWLWLVLFKFWCGSGLVCGLLRLLVVDDSSEVCLVLVSILGVLGGLLLCMWIRLVCIFVVV